MGGLGFERGLKADFWAKGSKDRKKEMPAMRGFGHFQPKKVGEKTTPGEHLRALFFPRRNVCLSE
jgi:hypothetical protein